jgi:uncharacterized membrane protein (DUF485 family)
MVRDGKSLETAAAAAEPLIAAKLKYLVPMTIVFLTSYVGLTALAGFAKGVVGVKVIGSVNLGYVLIGFNYGLSWLLAILYSIIAKSKFDPLASRAAADVLHEAPR